MELTRQFFINLIAGLAARENDPAVKACLITLSEAIDGLGEPQTSLGHIDADINPYNSACCGVC
jgi:hypothetical protein